MSKRATVAVVPCASYEETLVYQAVQKGLDMLGGIRTFVKPEEKILVKPNFLTPSEAVKAIVTHPAVIQAVLRILSENGYQNVTCGDSPGHGSNENAWKKIGLPEICYGATAANMHEEIHVDFPEGMTAKEFYICRGVVEADAIISICKMKTHALERITGAVKNVYGYVCGYRKAMGHVKYPNASVFARMLADIHRKFPARVHIMDGIVAMEGNGPGSGTPIPMRVLLLSRDPVALDTVFCRLVNLDPELIPTNVQGASMGIGTDCPEEIQVLLADGEKDSREISFDELFAVCGNGSFDVDRSGNKKTLLSRYSDIMTGFAQRPVIQKDLCVKCGICVEHCPVPGKAIDFKNGRTQPPVYDYERCIRCYCCQEMCPQHAIRVKRKQTNQ